MTDSEDIDFDGDTPAGGPAVSVADDGEYAWVQAWVRVPREAVTER